MEAVLNRVVRRLLSDYLEKNVDGNPTGQTQKLKLSMRGGQASLTDLAIRPQQYGPWRVEGGGVGKLSVRLPWRQWRSGRVLDVQLEKVRVLIRFDEEFDSTGASASEPDDVKMKRLIRKRSRVAATETLFTREAELDVRKHDWKKQFIIRWICRLGGWLNASLRDIEVEVILPSPALRVVLSWSVLALGSDKSSPSQRNVVHKTLSLEELKVVCKPEHHKQPAGHLLELDKAECSARLDLATPTFFLRVRIGSLATQWDADVLKELARTAFSLSQFDARSKFAKIAQRPGSRAQAREWWVFAVHCVLAEIRSHRTFLDESELLRRRRQRVEYMRLYTADLVTGRETLSLDERQRLNALEETLNEEEIVRFRLLARGQLDPSIARGKDGDDWMGILLPGEPQLQDELSEAARSELLELAGLDQEGLRWALAGHDYLVVDGHLHLDVVIARVESLELKLSHSAVHRQTKDIYASVAETNITVAAASASVGGRGLLQFRPRPEEYSVSIKLDENPSRQDVLCRTSRANIDLDARSIGAVSALHWLLELDFSLEDLVSSPPKSSPNSHVTVELPETILALASGGDRVTAKLVAAVAHVTSVGSVFEVDGRGEIHAVAQPKQEQPSEVLNRCPLSLMFESDSVEDVLSLDIDTIGVRIDLDFWGRFTKNLFVETSDRNNQGILDPVPSSLSKTLPSRQKLVHLRNRTFDVTLKYNTRALIFHGDQIEIQGALEGVTNRGYLRLAMVQMSTPEGEICSKITSLQGPIVSWSLCQSQIDLNVRAATLQTSVKSKALGLILKTLSVADATPSDSNPPSEPVPSSRALAGTIDIDEVRFSISDVHEEMGYVIMREVSTGLLLDGEEMQVHGQARHLGLDDSRRGMHRGIVLPHSDTAANSSPCAITVSFLLAPNQEKLAIDVDSLTVHVRVPFVVAVINEINHLLLCTTEGESQNTDPFELTLNLRSILIIVPYSEDRREAIEMAVDCVRVEQTTDVPDGHPIVTTVAGARGVTVISSAYLDSPQALITKIDFDINRREELGDEASSTAEITASRFIVTVCQDDLRLLSKVLSYNLKACENLEVSSLSAGPLFVKETFAINCPYASVVLLGSGHSLERNDPALQSEAVQLEMASLHSGIETNRSRASEDIVVGRLEFSTLSVWDLRATTVGPFRGVLRCDPVAEPTSQRELGGLIKIKSDSKGFDVKFGLGVPRICLSLSFVDHLVSYFGSSIFEGGQAVSRPDNSNETRVRLSIDSIFRISILETSASEQCRGLQFQLPLEAEISVTGALVENIFVTCSAFDVLYLPEGSASQALSLAVPERPDQRRPLVQDRREHFGRLRTSRLVPRRGSAGLLSRTESWSAETSKRRPKNVAVPILKMIPEELCYQNSTGLRLRLRHVYMQAVVCDFAAIAATIQNCLPTFDESEEEMKFAIPRMDIYVPHATLSLIADSGPLLRCKLRLSLSKAVEEQPLYGETMFALDGFNAGIDTWEPIVEEWSCIGSIMELKDGLGLKLSLSSAQPLNINFSPSALQIFGQFLHEVRSCQSSADIFGQMESRGLESSFYVENMTGERLIIRTRNHELQVDGAFCLVPLSGSRVEFELSGYKGKESIDLKHALSARAPFCRKLEGPGSSRCTILYDVLQVRSSHILRVRSAASVRNDSGMVLFLLSAQNVPFGKLCPGEERPLPIQLSGSYDGIRVVPYDERDHFHPSLPFFLQAVVDTEGVRRYACKPDRSASSPYLSSYVFLIGRRVLSKQYGEMQVLVTAPIVVRNCSSTQVFVEAQFGMERRSETLALSSGESGMLLRDPDMLRSVSFRSHGDNVLSIHFGDEDPKIVRHGNLEVELIRKEDGMLQLVIFFRYWLLYKAGRGCPHLHFAQQSVGLVARGQRFTLAPDHEGSMRGLRLAVDKENWSKRIDIVRGQGSVKLLDLRSNTRELHQFTVRVIPGSSKFYRTQVLLIRSRFEVANQCMVPLFWRQEDLNNTDPKILEPGQVDHAHWANGRKARRIVFKAQTTSWSPSIRFGDDKPEIVLRLPAGSCSDDLFLRVQTDMTDEDTTRMTVLGPIDEQLPIVVRNRSCRMVVLRQLWRPREMSMRVLPRETVRLDWNHDKRASLFEISTRWEGGHVVLGTISASAGQSRTDILRLPRIVCSYPVLYVRCTTIGTQTHVMVGDNVEQVVQEELECLRLNSLRRRTNGSVMEISISVAGVGFSLMGGKPTRELLFARLSGFGADGTYSDSSLHASMYLADAHIDNFVTSSVGATHVKPLLSRLLSQSVFLSHPLLWKDVQSINRGARLLEASVSLSFDRDSSGLESSSVVEVQGRMQLQPIEVNVDTALIAALGELAAMQQRFQNTISPEDEECDPLVVVGNQVEASVQAERRLFIKSLQISNVLVQLSVKVQGEDTRALSRLTGIGSMHALVLGNADRMQMRLANVRLTHLRTTARHLCDEIFRHYNLQLIYNLYEAVSSLDNMFWSPPRLLLLVRRGYEGIIGKIYKAPSPWAMVVGATREVLLASLAIVGRTFTKAIAAPDAFLTLWTSLLDLDDRGTTMESLRVAARGLQLVADGLGNIQLSKVGVGLVTFVSVAPSLSLARSLRSVSSVLDVVLDQIEVIETSKPLRPPRAFSPSGAILPYTTERADLGTTLLSQLRSPRFAKERYMFFALATASSGLLLTTRRVAFFEAGDDGTWRKVWHVPLRHVVRLEREGSELAIEGWSLEGTRHCGLGIAPERMVVPCLNEWTAEAIVAELAVDSSPPPDATVVISAGLSTGERDVS